MLHCRELPQLRSRIKHMEEEKERLAEKVEKAASQAAGMCMCLLPVKQLHYCTSQQHNDINPLQPESRVQHHWLSHWLGVGYLETADRGRSLVIPASAGSWSFSCLTTDTVAHVAVRSA